MYRDNGVQAAIKEHIGNINVPRHESQHEKLYSAIAYLVSIIDNAADLNAQINGIPSKVCGTDKVKEQMSLADVLRIAGLPHKEPA